MTAREWFRKKDNLFLLAILLTGFVLRFYRLGYQSFWVDEMHTMKQTDPTLTSWSWMFDSLGRDQHPPLFYILERCLFTLFGTSEFLGRLLPALFGTLSIWAMYLLGKEIGTNKLGLIAAALTCLNYFCLYYSQEARDYMLVFLGATLSYLYFVRMIRSPDKTNRWLYTLFAIVTVYSHYYGIFVVCAQFAIAFFLLFAEKDKKTFIKNFIICGIVIVVAYSAWIPSFLKTAKIHSFWNPPVTQDFIFTYFFEYFGQADFLKPLLAAVLLFYVLKVFNAGFDSLAGIKYNSLLLSFVLFVFTAVFVYLAPYIRSQLTVPMLFDRYTIVILPLFLLCLAYGMSLIPGRITMLLVLVSFLGLSFVDITVSKRYYTNVSKAQFRELTTFIAADKTSKFPVLDDGTSWQEEYYTHKFKYAGELMGDSRAVEIDSIIKRTSPRYAVDGFWLISNSDPATKDTYLDDKTKAALNADFMLARERIFTGVWAQLYILKRNVARTLDTAGFSPADVADVGNEKVVAIWGGSVVSKPFKLSKGKYLVNVFARGTPAAGQYPHLIVSIDGKTIGDYYTTNNFENAGFSYAIPGDTDSSRLKIDLVNDYKDPVTNDDRNAFLKNILFIKTE